MLQPTDMYCHEPQDMQGDVMYARKLSMVTSLNFSISMCSFCLKQPSIAQTLFTGQSEFGQQDTCLKQCYAVWLREKLKK